jgi:alkanesulfonate monooxygenase SsuD/methylene tetrahydromethanopterin reductase-like flavin-dependent oxidoreductase (luciferase family)
MPFGLYRSVSARRGGPECDSREGFRDGLDDNIIEAEALGFHSTFVVGHHFSGYGQVSATLTLLTWLDARTRRLRLGTAVLVVPWHNPVLAEPAARHCQLAERLVELPFGVRYSWREPPLHQLLQESPLLCRHH